MRKSLIAFPVLFWLLAAVAGAVYSEDLQPEMNNTLALFEFESESVLSAELKALSTQFESAMFANSPYTIISGTERDKILEEMNFSLSGMTDENSRIEAGRLLSAFYISVASVEIIDSRYYINIKIIETESTRVISSVRREFASVQSIMDNMDALARELSASVLPPKEPISLLLSGAANGSLVIPLNTDLFTPGGAIAGRFGFSLSSLNFLTAGIEISGDLLPLRSEGILILMKGGLFLDFLLPAIGLFTFDIIASGGYWYGLVSDSPDLAGGNLFVKAGIIFSMDISPGMQIGIEGSFTFHNQLVNTINAGVTFGIRQKEETSDE
ncbi:MAG: hypothetical protein JW874_12185 [Spirochaetales bacterium]|nr:hypothetical protein [Spirochaetales bacterium]